MVNSSRDHGNLAIGEGSMADWVEVILHHQTQQLGRKMKRVEKSTQLKIKTSREVAFLIHVGSRVVVAAISGGWVEFGPFMVLCRAVCLDLGWSPDLWIQTVSLVWTSGACAQQVCSWPDGPFLLAAIFSSSNILKQMRFPSSISEANAAPSTVQEAKNLPEGDSLLLCDAV